MNDRAVRDAAAAWLAAGRSAVVVEVVDFKGSVPRETGTRMLVATDAVAGTIGGGHLELQAIEQARALLTGLPCALARSGMSASERPCALMRGAGQASGLARDAREVHEREIALGPSLGQCCGGVLRLRWQALSAALLGAWPEPPPLFELQLYGAGHVGRAIVRLLDTIDCRVWWIDERDSEFPPTPSAAHVRRVCVEPVEAEVATAPPGAFFLVLTHSHELDLRITEAILRRGDFGYLGLIGSATKRARFAHRFAQRGIPAETIERMVCPIGVPGIAGKQPGVIAVAVAAQLLQHAGAPS